MSIKINLNFCRNKTICLNKILFYTAGLESPPQAEIQMFTELGSYIRKQFCEEKEVMSSSQDTNIQNILKMYLPQKYFSKIENSGLEEKIKKFCSEEKRYLSEYKNNGYKLSNYEKDRKISLLNVLQNSFINIETTTMLHLNILDKWQKENNILYIANFYTFTDIAAEDDVKIFGKFIFKAIGEQQANAGLHIRMLNLRSFKESIIEKTNDSDNQQLIVSLKQGLYNEYSCPYCEYSILCKTLACDSEKSETGEEDEQQ